MRIRHSILTFLCGVLAVAGATAQAQSVQPPDSLEKYRKCSLQERMFDGYCLVSMVDLIANPELFDGRKVLVVGYVHIEFEGRGIYFHKDDFTYGISRNALWLSSAGSIDLTKCQGSYARVRGIFRAGIGGHADTFTGTLDQVAACDKASPRRG